MISIIKNIENNKTKYKKKFLLYSQINKNVHHNKSLQTNFI